jgi:hypothetical protein
MKLSVSVMASPAREEYFPFLRRMLGNDTPFSIDHKSLGVWPNCANSWSLYDPTADWHAVVQDDGIPCEHFKERALEAIERSGGTHALSFYYGKRGNLTEQSKKGLERGFIIDVAPKWGVAICLKTAWIDEMLEYTNKMSHRQDDYRIGMWLKHKGIKTYFPMPSLVDHRRGPSLIGDPGSDRVAYSFIDRV